MINLKELERIHRNMKEEFLNDNIEILDIYICPHHWNQGCYCRKPSPGMLLKASRDWLLRLDKTLFIGDDYRDCQTSYNAGCKSILVGDMSEMDKLLEQEKPIFATNNLKDCVSNILEFFNSNNINDYN